MAQALKAIEIKNLQEVQFITASLGAIGVTVASAAGAKNSKTDWYDFVPDQLRVLTKERSGVTKKTAQIFKKLLNEGKVPRWVLSLLDVKKIVEEASG